MATEFVRLTRMVIHNGEVREAGEVLTVPEGLAYEWAQAGKADFQVRVKALRDNILVGRHILVTGQEANSSQSQAFYLHEEGVVDILNPEILTDVPPQRKPPVRPVSPPDPFNGEPRIKVKVITENLMFNRTHHGRGVILELPESLACKELKGGFVELAPGARLTPAGQSYLSALKNQRARAGDIYPTYA